MAVATVSLSSTTFARTVERGDTSVLLASTSGVVPGVRLYADRELMAVVSLGLGNEVNVRRGSDGTSTDRHATTVTVWFGNPCHFYASDPYGLPNDPVSVYPYINVLNGNVWVPQGDETGSGVSGRSWQLVTNTQQFGAFGIRQNTITTPV